MVKKQKKPMLLRVLLLVAVVCVIGLGVHAQKEAQAAEYPYLIKVNRKMCTVTVYKKDKKGNYTVPVKAMLCSPGWDTPLGTFRTPAKYRWKLLQDNVWGQYSTRITGGILFHSVWYYQKDPSTLSNVQFNKLGTVCSHGCVRLNVEDAKWIYDNCAVGTTVTIYDSNDPGPLGKPAGIKVSTASRTGYDPTDRWSPGNPYFKNQKPPVISGVKNKTVEYGESVNVKSGVTAKMSNGTNITKDIKVSIKYNGKKVSKINTKKTGKYYVTYTVKDSSGKSASKTGIYTVVDNVAPVIKGAKNLYINTEAIEINEELAAKNVKATWHGKDITSKLKVTVTVDSGDDDLMIYLAEYEVKASNGKTASVKKYIYVDLKAPVFKGVENREYTDADTVDESFALEGVSVKDNLNKIKADQIKVTIAEAAYGYDVTYAVSDKAGNQAKETVRFIRGGLFWTEGMEDRTIPAGQPLTQAAALEGAAVYQGIKDITAECQISVIIAGPLDHKYTVTYTIILPDGTTEIKTACFTLSL